MNAPQAAGFNPPGAGLEGGLEGLVRGLLAPERVTRALVQRALRRARRLGLYWRVLEPLERAVLEAASRASVEEYRSPRVKRLLAAIIAKIEEYTMRGLVLKAGLSYALSRGLLALPKAPRALLGALRSKLSYIRYLGRSILEVYSYFAPLMKP